MGERIAQAVFFERFDVHFEKVSSKEDLGVTKRGSGGFGSTGTTVIKKMKVNEKFQDDSLAIIAEEGVISKKMKSFYMRRSTTKVDFFILAMLVKKSYLIIFFPYKM